MVEDVGFARKEGDVQRVPVLSARALTVFGVLRLFALVERESGLDGVLRVRRSQCYSVLWTRGSINRMSTWEGKGAPRKATSPARLHDGT